MLTLPKMMSFSYHLKGSLINTAVYERLSTSPSFIYSFTVDKKVLLQRMNFHKSYFRASARFILEHCNSLVTTHWPQGGDWYEQAVKLLLIFE